MADDQNDLQATMTEGLVIHPLALNRPSDAEKKREKNKKKFNGSSN